MLPNRLGPASPVGCIANDSPDRAIELFGEIENPDDVIITLLFNACAKLKTDDALDLVKRVAAEIPKSAYTNIYLVTSLLDALIKCGDVGNARSLFDSTENKVVPMYGAMMTGYTKNNQPGKALELFTAMEIEQVFPDKKRNALIDAKMTGADSTLVLYLCAIDAASHLAMSDISDAILQRIPPSFLVHSHMQNALINMWVSKHYLSENS
jgi:pentatricopeptide repeat protein